MSLKEKLGKFKPVGKQGPAWAGPSGEGPQGGVTQGLVAQYLVCPERFRLKVIEGLAAPDHFNVRLEFGNLWHKCEEALASAKELTSRDVEVHKLAHGYYWQVKLDEAVDRLKVRYPFDRDEIDKWANVIRCQFPCYVQHWAEHPDVKNRTPIEQEQTFDVAYKLPSGRIVRLRGKRDAVDLIEDADGAGIYLQENKTKSRIDERLIKRQLSFDLQTMLYLVALQEWVTNTEPEEWPKLVPIKGVRYNVIRRDCPIRQHQATKGSKCPKCKGTGALAPMTPRRLPNCPKCRGGGRINAKPEETREHYYQRLTDDYFLAKPEEWFMRWKCEVSSTDVARFKRECLHPVLENLCDDYEWWAGKQLRPGVVAVSNPFDCETRAEQFKHHRPRHYRMPYLYSPLVEGVPTELDEYLATGNAAGLRRVTDLFPELAEGS